MSNEEAYMLSVSVSLNILNISSTIRLLSFNVAFILLFWGM